MNLQGHHELARSPKIEQIVLSIKCFSLQAKIVNTHNLDIEISTEISKGVNFSLLSLLQALP